MKRLTATYLKEIDEVTPEDFADIRKILLEKGIDRFDLCYLPRNLRYHEMYQAFRNYCIYMRDEELKAEGLVKKMYNKKKLQIQRKEYFDDKKFMFRPMKTRVLTDEIDAMEIDIINFENDIDKGNFELSSPKDVQNKLKHMYKLYDSKVGKLERYEKELTEYQKRKAKLDNWLERLEKMKKFPGHAICLFFRSS